MFEKLRRPKQAGKQSYLKKLAYFVVFGAICLVFVFLGPSLPNLSGKTIAAYVGRKPVYLRELAQAEENLSGRYRGRWEKAGEEETRRLQSQIRKEALAHLIRQSLAFQGAEKSGFRLSDAELREAIRSFPVFQSKGRFIYSQYLAFLKSRGMRASQFEGIIRRERLAANWSGLFFKAFAPHSLEAKKNRQRGLVQIKVRFAQLGLGEALEETLEPLVQSGDLKGAERFLKGIKAKWRTTKKFSPAKSFIPELDNSGILREAILDHLPQKGLIPQLVKKGNKFYIAEVLSVETKAPQKGKEGDLSRLAGFEKPGRLFLSWLEEQKRVFPVEVSAGAGIPGAADSF